MKRLFTKGSVPLAFAAAIVASSGAQAGALVSGNNQYEDEDYESQVFDSNQDGKLGEGDILLAILEIQSSLKVDGTPDGDLNDSVTQDAANRIDYGATTNTLTAVSLIQVSSVTVSGNSAQYTFEGVSAADWLTYAGLTIDGDEAMAILYDDPANANGHIDPSASGTPGDGDLTSEVGTAADGTKLAEFGFAGDAGEFWTASSLTIIPGGDPTDVTQITTLEFFAALNYTSGEIDGLVKHNLLGDPDLLGTASLLFTDAAYIQIQGTKATGTTGNFQLKTDTDLYLSVPVPGTLALLGLGLAGLGFGFRRKTL